MNEDVEIAEYNAKIRRIEENQQDFEKYARTVQLKEEDNEQSHHRAILELDYMAEDCQGDRKLMQLIDEQRDIMQKIKRNRTALLDALHDEHEKQKSNTKYRLEELQDIVERIEVKRNDD